MLASHGNLRVSPRDWLYDPGLPASIAPGHRYAAPVFGLARPGLVCRGKGDPDVMLGRYLAALPLVGLIAWPASAAPATELMWDCQVERTLAGGSAYAARKYRQTGQLFAGDSLHWNATGYDPAAPRAPIEWNLSYPWAAERGGPFDDRRIKLAYQVRGGEPLPEVMLLHIQRPMPVEPHGVIASTALVTLTFRNHPGDPTGGQGDLPLGDLLAYAGPYDALDWFLTDRHDQYGHARKLAAGQLSIAALREAGAAFRDMRRELERKGKTFRTACPLREVVLPVPHPR